MLLVERSFFSVGNGPSSRCLTFSTMRITSHCFYDRTLLLGYSSGSNSEEDSGSTKNSTSQKGSKSDNDSESDNDSGDESESNATSCPLVKGGKGAKTASQLLPSVNDLFAGTRQGLLWRRTHSFMQTRLSLRDTLITPLNFSFFCRLVSQ